MYICVYSMFSVWCIWDICCMYGLSVVGRVYVCVWCLWCVWFMCYMYGIRAVGSVYVWGVYSVFWCVLCMVYVLWEVYMCVCVVGVYVYALVSMVCLVCVCSWYIVVIYGGGVYMYLFMYMYMCVLSQKPACSCWFSFPPFWSHRWNAGCQTWLQAALLSEPRCQPVCVLIKSLL